MSSKRVVSAAEMVVSKNKNKVLCSTPEHRIDSPSRDSDSLCDSDAASPVPFLCTQDGTEGETDVIWNHYTPKSASNKRRSKNTTPLSRRSKKSLRPKILEKPLPKRKTLKVTQKKNELFQELLELNQNLQEIISNKTEKNALKDIEAIEDDVFNDSLEFSPKCGVKSNSCLRKNVLSSKFTKPEPDNGLESDDSMNECLLKATQMVEENIFKHDVPKTVNTDVSHCKPKCINPSLNFKMDNDSMDAILNSIKLDSPCPKRVKKCQSPPLNNDSFDMFVENLNDSALERLTQMPTKTKTPVRETNKVKKPTEITMDGQSPFSKSIFGRYSSMPESPSLKDIDKPSSSGMTLGRYSSMPIDKNGHEDPGDSPIRCTPEEIKKKHQLAREKLLAKRQLPFTVTQSTIHSGKQETVTTSKCKFQPKVPSDKAFNINKNNSIQTKCDIPLVNRNTSINRKSNETADIKTVIEKKRQEALLKLRLRKVQPKT